MECRWVPPTVSMSVRCALAQPSERVLAFVCVMFVCVLCMYFRVLILFYTDKKKMLISTSVSHLDFFSSSVYRCDGQKPLHYINTHAISIRMYWHRLWIR